MDLLDHLFLVVLLLYDLVSKVILNEILLLSPTLSGK
jgi:hypothetical protein